MGRGESILRSGEVLMPFLNPGDWLACPDSFSPGDLRLILAPNGDLGLLLTTRGNDQVLWSTGTGRPTRNIDAQLHMNRDGSLVLYDIPNALWSTGTRGNPGAFLLLQPDRNLVLYRYNTPIWTSNTWRSERKPSPPPPPSIKDHLNPGGTLQLGEGLISKSGQFRLWMQTDSNLVLYDIDEPIWESGTFGQNVAYCLMQTDGNLVLYRSNGSAVWASGILGGFGRASFVVQNDGNMVVYGLVAIWDRFR